MRRVLALTMAFGLGLQARAEESAPGTAATLLTVSPQEAAQRLFGPTSETFVERAPFNTIVPNYVAGTVGKVQMELYAVPERIAPSACAVTVAWALVDLGFQRRGSDGDHPASSDAAAPASATLDDSGRKREYFAAGPAPATPAVPDGEPIAPGEAASAKDSCANPVALRRRFEAPSDEVAVLLISKTNAAMAAAKRRGPLPFKLHYECSQGGESCRPRRWLADLKTGWMDRVVLDDGCKSDEGLRLPRGAKRCLSFAVYDSPVGGYSYTSFEFVLGKSDRLLDVHVSGPNSEPII